MPWADNGDYRDNTMQRILSVDPSVDATVSIPTSDAAPRPAKHTSRGLAMTAATLGTVVEYADWAIYAAFASLFSPHFFPSNDPTTSLLATFGVFAIGFVTRPIGGAVLGAYSDRHGRKKALTLSITLMAGSSILIAICPGYETLGRGAPLILIFARLLQGFSAGGEFGSGSTFLVETGRSDRRGFSGSFQHAAVNAGVLVASLIGFALTSQLSSVEMAAWGWRLGFGIAGLLGLVVLWLRLVVSETASFQAVAAKGTSNRRPLLEVFQKHPRAALRVIGIAMAGNLISYLWLVHFPTYVHVKTGLPLKDAFTASLISIAVSLVLVPLAGALSDRVGRRPVLIAFALGSAVFVGPGLAALSNDFWVDTAVVTIGMALASLFAGVVACAMAEQFPAEVRATGVSFPYAIAVTLFGGTAPYIVTAFTKAGIDNLLWVYVAAVCLISCVVYLRMPETSRSALD